MHRHTIFGLAVPTFFDELSYGASFLLQLLAINLLTVRIQTRVLIIVHLDSWSRNLTSAALWQLSSGILFLDGESYFLTRVSSV